MKASSLICFTYTANSITVRTDAAGDAAALGALRRRDARAILSVWSAADAVVKLHQREQREDWKETQYDIIFRIYITFSLLLLWLSPRVASLTSFLSGDLSPIVVQKFRRFPHAPRCSLRPGRDRTVVVRLPLPSPVCDSVPAAIIPGVNVERNAAD